MTPSPGGSFLPPLQLSMPTSATSGDARGGSAGGAGMGALNQGDWIIQRNSGSGSISAATGGKSNWLYVVLAAGAAWMLARQ